MHIVIIGGGAAGFMAAITAAESRAGNKITLLEKSQRVLAKVRISGGGRCNVTHRPSPSSSFSKNYPRGQKFIKPLLGVFSASDTISWFESRGVTLKTEPDGRVFPVTDSSDTIVHCLVESARKAGVEIRTGVTVNSFTKDRNGFRLALQNGAELTCDRLLIATGGTPKLTGYDWIAADGHPVVSPVPSLFTFNTPENYLTQLPGISVQQTKIKITGTALKSEGPTLITHWGFSGPAILRLSAWGARELAATNYQFEIRINWTGDQHLEQVRTFLYELKTNYPKQQLAAHPQFDIPGRLWRTFTEHVGVNSQMKLGDTPHKSLNKLAMLLTDHPFNVSGKTTFKEEFVTCGGIDLAAVDPTTMESKRVKGLYFAGEVIDVDGITGGFNFQNAWSTGWIAGKNLIAHS